MLAEHLGAETVVGLKLGADADADALGAAASRGLPHVRLPGERPFAHGETQEIRFAADDLHFFDLESGERLTDV